MDRMEYFEGTDAKLAFKIAGLENRVSDVGVLFVHAAFGNRLGPSRMFVEYERKFNKFGLATMRFDLAGCGESYGKCSFANIERDGQDILRAATFFVKQLKLKGVLLFGISRGAYLAYNVVNQDNDLVRAAILLSTPGPGRFSGAKNLSHGFAKYLCKLKKAETVKRILSGQVDLVGVWQTLVNAGQIKKRYPEIRGAGKIDSKLLFIYAEKDPICREAKKFYMKKCTDNNIEFICKTIKGANHSFFHYQWKEEILNICIDWIKNDIKIG